MANTFRADAAGRDAFFRDSLQSLGSGGAASAFVGRPSGSSSSALEAVERASRWQEQHLGTIGAELAQNNQNLSRAASFGISSAADEQRYEMERQAAKKANASNRTSGIFGTIANVATTAAPFLLACERRLKRDIEPIPHAQAWEAVRDIPLYSFAYKANPGNTCYGPMVDEVLPVDPSLVRPTLLPDDEVGSIQGFDVMRHQAMQAVALQQALLRIEALEARLEQLQPTAPWPHNVAAPGATPATFSWPHNVAAAA